MIEAYKKFWKGYVDFTGRSTPSDYWFAYSAHVLIFFAYYLLDAVFERILSTTGSRAVFTISLYLLLIFFAYGVAAILPGIAITVRRLRDAGCNWLYIFYSFNSICRYFYLNFSTMSTNRSISAIQQLQ